MKIIEYTTENYEFKKAMQKNIIENIQPLLYENKFVKDGTRTYVRELDGLLQFIVFKFEKDRMLIWGTFLPIIVSSNHDGLQEYGDEITYNRISYGKLSDKKYYISFYEPEKFDIAIQLQNYKNKHIPNLENLILIFKEGVLPEMDRINSFRRFVMEIESPDASFLSRKYDNRLRGGVWHNFFVAVDKCFSDQFTEGIAELKKIKEYLDPHPYLEVEFKGHTENILKCLDCDLSQRKNNFLAYMNQMRDERRKKYKRLKPALTPWE